MKRNNLKQERGIFHVIMTFLLVPILGVLAVAIDGFMIMTADLEQDNNAEYVGLTAIREYRELTNTQFNSSFGARQALAADLAKKVASKNHYIGTNVNPKNADNNMSAKVGNIEFGFIDGNVFVEGGQPGRTEANGDPYINAVRVTLETNKDNSVAAIFGKIFGITQTKISAQSVNFFNEARGDYGVLR